MRKTVILILLLTLTAFAFAQTGSRLLHRGSGDITGAVLSAGGLIVSQETSAEMVKTDIFDGAARTDIPVPGENQRVFFSPNGGIAVVADYAGQGDYYEIPQFRVMELISGNEITIQGIPGLSGLFLSDRGNLIGVIRNINIAEKSQLLFYNPEGVLLKTVPFPAVTQVKFSPEGGFAGAVSGTKGLVIFTAEGEEVTGLGPCQWFDVRESGSGVVCAFTDGMSAGLYSQIGSWKMQFGDEIFRDVAVSSDGSQVLAVSKHHLFYLDGTGAMIMERSVVSPRSFTTCALEETAPGESCAAYGWETDTGREVRFTGRHTQGGFTLVTNPGTADQGEFTEELKYSNWNVFTPDVKFSQGGLLIQTMDEVRYVKLNEEGR